MHKSCEINLKQFAGDYMPVFSERSVKMHIEIIHNTYLQEVNKICNVRKLFYAFNFFQDDEEFAKEDFVEA
jgi:hypothetical protein